MSHRVGVVGFRGYSGMEAVRILERHPQVEPWLLEHRQDAAERPSPRGAKGPERAPCTPEAAAQAGIEVVLLATPPEISMNLAPAMLSGGRESD